MKETEGFVNKIRMKNSSLKLFRNFKENGKKSVQAVGFEPTHVAISDLESDPLDHSGTLAR